MRGEDDSVVKPADMLEYAKRVRGLSSFGVAEVCIGCFETRIFRRLIEKAGARKEDRWIDNKLYTFSIGGTSVNIRKFDWGAPAAVHNLELLIAAGAKYFIIFGGAGALQEDLEPGDLIVVRRAIRDEGTSYHYLPPSRTIEGSRLVLECLKRACEQLGARFRVGDVWTTDAFFRESRRLVERYKSWGVLACEMEAAALYAVSRFRGASTGLLLYVSDSVAGPSWRPFFFEDKVLEAIDRGIDVVLRATEILVEQVRGMEIQSIFGRV